MQTLISFPVWVYVVLILGAFVIGFSLFKKLFKLAVAVAVFLIILMVISKLINGIAAQ